MTALAGFLFGAFGQKFDVAAFIGVLAGTALVIGAGCVFNNITDRRIDAKMQRTKQRALVTGIISVKNALIYGMVLLVVGLAVLVILTNKLPVIIGIVGLVDYVVFYGLFKRRSTVGTLVGSICGATAVVAGYCAATAEFNTAAFLLFLIMVLWQMPHFYSIAIYRGKEYKAAGIPVLPLIKGITTAKIHIAIYTILFIAANVLLYTTGYAGVSYLVVMILAGGWWLSWAFKGFKASDNDKWARKMFGNSLIVLMIFSVMISINYWLP